MRFLLALAAFLVAATSLAAASQLCPDSYEAAAASHTDDDCHDGADRGLAGEGCDFAAHCAMLCGVALPAGPQSAFNAELRSLIFATGADYPHSISASPEAPPPRAALL